MTGSSNSLSLASRGSVLPTYARADVTIVRGEGCRVWDDEGRSYLDFGSGIAVAGLGHRHPAVTAAAHAQLDRLWHASNLYWTEPMLRLAELPSPSAWAVRRRSSATRARRPTRRRSRSPERRPAAPESSRSTAASTAAPSARCRRPVSPEVGGLRAARTGFSFARPNDVESLEPAVSPGGDSRRSSSSRCKARAA